MAPARRDWSVWTCDASVVVAEPGELDDAVAMVRSTLDDVARACDRFDRRSELSRLGAGPHDGVRVSVTLAHLIDRALDAADLTGGAVDPTLGRELIDLGYADRLPGGPPEDRLPLEVAPTRRRSSWQRIRVDGDRVTLPEGVVLDLGASAKAVAVDLCVARLATTIRGGALVSIGGDLATTPRPVDGGWQVMVRDLEGDPAQQIELAPGWAMATSSTQKRRWASRGYARHHILDPASGRPVAPVWRTVSVAARTCLDANALATGAIVTGPRAADWLRRRGAIARLVDARSRVVVVGAWPAPEARSVVAAR